MNECSVFIFKSFGPSLLSTYTLSKSEIFDITILFKVYRSNLLQFRTLVFIIVARIDAFITYMIRTKFSNWPLVD